MRRIEAIGPVSLYNAVRFVYGDLYVNVTLAESTHPAAGVHRTSRECLTPALNGEETNSRARSLWNGRLGSSAR